MTSWKCLVPEEHLAWLWREFSSSPGCSWGFSEQPRPAGLTGRCCICFGTAAALGCNSIIHGSFSSLLPGFPGIKMGLAGLQFSPLITISGNLPVPVEWLSTNMALLLPGGNGRILILLQHLYSKKFPAAFSQLTGHNKPCSPSLLS